MKGHSDRVPSKNIKNIAGKPLCLWVLETLLRVKKIDEIIINTDSDEIKKICSINEKIRFHKRPNWLVGDYVSMNDIIAYEVSLSGSADYIQTHSTNPLIKYSTIESAIKKYLKNKNKFDSLFSVTRLQTRIYNDDKKPLNHDPKKLLRTQDLPPIYEENSNIYLFSDKSFKKNNRRIGDNPIFFEMDAKEAIDIDEMIDFEIAEFLLSKINLE